MCSPFPGTDVATERGKRLCNDDEISRTYVVVDGAKAFWLTLSGGKYWLPSSLTGLSDCARTSPLSVTLTIVRAVWYGSGGSVRCVQGDAGWCAVYIANSQHRGRARQEPKTLS